MAHVQRFPQALQKASISTIIIDPRDDHRQGYRLWRKVFWIRWSGLWLNLFSIPPVLGSEPRTKGRQSRDGELIWQVDLVSCFIARCLFQNRRHPKEIVLLEPNYRSVGRSTGSQNRTWPHNHGTNLLLTGEENSADLKTMNLNEGFSICSRFRRNLYAYHVVD